MAIRMEFGMRGLFFRTGDYSVQGDDCRTATMSQGTRLELGTVCRPMPFRHRYQLYHVHLYYYRVFRASAAVFEAIE